jgi:demethylmenaquinone methyltransferase/2-methoxy-6-polyprenyl-1,4-benzoquinol methylase
MSKDYYSYIKNWFRKEAPTYNLLVDIPLSKLRDKVVNIVNAKEGSKILDIATGTGGQAFAFAKKGYDVIGIDLSEDMLTIAHKKNRYKNLKFKITDATCIPFENGHFDVSCISFALHDMPLSIRKKALEEMVRVTKTKGIIVILDYASPKNKITRFLTYPFIKSYETKYFPEFIKSDLEELFENNGIEIEKKLSIFLGCAKILIGINL